MLGKTSGNVCHKADPCFVGEIASVARKPADRSVLSCADKSHLKCMSPRGRLGPSTKSKTPNAFG